MSDTLLTLYYKEQYKKHADRKSRKWLQANGHGTWIGVVDEEESKQADNRSVLQILDRWRNT